MPGAMTSASGFERLKVITGVQPLARGFGNLASSPLVEDRGHPGFELRRTVPSRSHHLLHGRKPAPGTDDFYHLSTCRKIPDRLSVGGPWINVQAVSSASTNCPLRTNVLIHYLTNLS